MPRGADVPSGIGGYFLVGANAPGDILTALPDTAWDVNVARLCVTFTVVFSYPLLQYVAAWVPVAVGWSRAGSSVTLPVC